jgi:hypothetical protein
VSRISFSITFDTKPKTYNHRPFTKLRYNSLAHKTQTQHMDLRFLIRNQFFMLCDVTSSVEPSRNIKENKQGGKRNKKNGGKE